MSAIAQNLIGFGVIGAVLYLIYKMITSKNPKFKEYFESKKPKSILSSTQELREQLRPQNRVAI